MDTVYAATGPLETQLDVLLAQGACTCVRFDDIIGVSFTLTFCRYVVTLGTTASLRRRENLSCRF